MHRSPIHLPGQLGRRVCEDEVTRRATATRFLRCSGGADEIRGGLRSEGPEEEVQRKRVIALQRDTCQREQSDWRSEGAPAFPSLEEEAGLLLLARGGLAGHAGDAAVLDAALVDAARDVEETLHPPAGVPAVRDDPVLLALVALAPA